MILAPASFKTQMLCSGSNSGVGGRDIDLALANHFAAVFKDNTGHDVKQDSQAWLRLLVESENFKPSMAGTDTAQQQFVVRNLMEGKDLSSSMDRFIFHIGVQESFLIYCHCCPLTRAYRYLYLESKRNESIDFSYMRETIQHEQYSYQVLLPLISCPTESSSMSCAARSGLRQKRWLSMRLGKAVSRMLLLLPCSLLFLSYF
jgi:hypothetical protein